MSIGSSFSRAVMRQFGHPRGVLGHGVGWMLATRSSNRERNAWVVSLLDIQPDDRVLEIGFGPGLAIHAASEKVVTGVVCGVDHSDVMVRQASKRNADAIAAGRVDLRVGSAEELPDFGGRFDKVYAVNSMGFWRDPVACLLRLQDVMRPGGTIAIASQPRGPRATEGGTERASAEIEGRLMEAGYTILRIEALLLEPAVVCVLATVDRAAN